MFLDRSNGYNCRTCFYIRISTFSIHPFKMKPAGGVQLLAVLLGLKGCLAKNFTTSASNVTSTSSNVANATSPNRVLLANGNGKWARENYYAQLS